MTVVAVPIQVFEMTGSTLAVGVLGLVQLIPTLLMGVWGGSIADAVDRRKLLGFTQTLLGATAALLMVNAMLDEPLLWPLYVLSAANAGLLATDGPTRSAVVPMIVGRNLIASALALQQILVNVARTIGPAIAGLLIAQTSLTVTYAVEAVGFVAGAFFVTRLGPLPPEREEGSGPGLRSILDGLAFLRERRLLQANFLMDINAMVFGMPTALFPAIGTEILGGDEFTVGLIYTAIGVGGLVAAVTSGWVSRVRFQGRAVIAAVIVWGGAMAGFGLARTVPVALVLVGIAGAADVISAIFRTTILQVTVPDNLRGRLSGVHVAVVAGGPRLGDLEAGAVATVTSVPFSVVSGGLACIVGAALMAWRFPRYRNYVEDTADA